MSTGLLLANAVRTVPLTPTCDTNTFVNLPTELKLMILERMPNVDSLINLVMASPDFYRCYKFAGPTAIFIAATLRELRARDIIFRVPTAYLEVRLTGGRAANATLRAAISQILELLLKDKPVILSIDQCHALLKLEEVIWWGPHYSSTEDIRSIRMIMDYINDKAPHGSNRFSYVAIDKGLVRRQYNRYEASAGKLCTET